MSGDDKKQPPEDRTIFIPGAGSQVTPDAEPAAPVDAAPADDAAPVDAPLAAVPPPAPASPSASASEPAAPDAANAAAPSDLVVPGVTTPGVGANTGSSPGSSWSGAGQFAPGEEGRRIQIGDVLNHIFEVRRFIGRGGMGEVFEGVNINTEERVAIKVILPHLAADPQVQAMFRKEARTLTRLSHPGLVQYRVLAMEPQLRALYIVTEFIDGPNLSDKLATLDASPDQLVALLGKLAEGLAAAHSLGAIHRDISPDNVMLEGGQIERAKVIDFGIAKDLDAVGGTIVGDGFAGKLNYVAPEQLGDFDREIGPWTDVYSLGLTMMAAVLGRDVNMGATLVDAVDKRRAGLDVSCAPEAMRPVLDLMLRANPAERLRSMADVLHMLGSTGAATSFGSLTPRTELGGALGGGGYGGGGGPAAGKRGVSPRMLALLGGGAGLLAAGALALTYFGGERQAAGPAGPDGDVEASQQTAHVAPPADPLGTARQVLATEFKTVPCSWLDVADIRADGARITLSIHGVSGESASAMRLIGNALKRVGLQASSIDMDVSPIPANMCRPIEAFNQIRAVGAPRLVVAQHQFEMDVLPDRAGADAGKLGAQPVFTLNLSGLPDEVSLVGLDEAGEMQQLASSKAEIAERAPEQLGPDNYRFIFNTTHSGWSGILLLTGKAPFDANLTSTSKSRGSSNWAARFVTLARERGWKSEMVWYKTVDQEPNRR